MSPDVSDYFDLHASGAATIARVSAEVIRHPEQAHEFARDLRALVDRDGVRSLVVDLRHTHDLGSTAFGALFALAKHLTGLGGRLALCHLHPDLLPGAAILGLSSVVPLFDTEAQALATF